MRHTASKVILQWLMQCKLPCSHAATTWILIMLLRIMFIREFPTIDAAVSTEQLKMRLKDKELEEYGEAFIPEFVYEVIRRLPRFSSMRVSIQIFSECTLLMYVCSGDINKMLRNFWDSF